MTKTLDESEKLNRTARIWPKITRVSGVNVHDPDVLWRSRPSHLRELCACYCVCRYIWGASSFLKLAA